MTVQEEFNRSSVFVQNLEVLGVSKGSVTLGQAGDRDKLLLAHWSLALDLDKSRPDERTSRGLAGEARHLQREHRGTWAQP